MCYTDDPGRDFDRWDRGQAKLLERLPECCVCGEPIQQDDAVRIGGDWYCDGCIDGMREYINMEDWDERF